jgi:type VI secretion system secreted protein Hcp
MARAKGIRRVAESLIARPLLVGAMAAGAVAATTAPVPALAAAYMKLGDIKGESTDDRHKDEIAIVSYSQTFSNSATSAPGARSAGGATCGPVHVLKNIDRASPGIIRLAVTGQHTPEAITTFSTEGESPSDYYKVTMTDVVVTLISQADTADPARIIESVGMIARTFRFEYTRFNPDGTPGPTQVFSFDCGTNKAL